MKVDFEGRERKMWLLGSWACEARWTSLDRASARWLFVGFDGLRRWGRGG